jgi:hypothetical protein
VCEVCGSYGGCVDAEDRVAVVGHAAETVLLQWVLGYACSWGDSCLIMISACMVGSGERRLCVWLEGRGVLIFGISQSVTSKSI